MKESRWITILIFISVFVSSITFFTEPFEGYFHYLIFLVLLPYFIAKFGLPGKPLQIFILPLIIGIVQVVLGNNTWELLIKVFVGLSISTLFYYYVLLYYKLNVERIFELYLNGAVIISVIGLVEFVSFILHFTPGYNYSWLFNKWGIVPGEFGIRVNSIFSEASQFAIMLGPASFVAIYSLLPGSPLLLHRWQSIVILVTLLLTTSSTGYLGLFFIVFLLMLNYGRIGIFFVGLLVMIGGGTLLYNTVDAFRSRVDTSIGLWVNDDLSINNVNSSSFVLYNNYHVALENFKENFLTGTGLGSHPIAFDKYSITKRTDIIDIKFNKADGNSLFVRLLSETGLIGIVFIFWVIFKFFVRRNPLEPDNHLWLVSNSALVIILLYMLRQGNYFLNGFPLFMWLYYFSSQLHTGKEEVEQDEDEETETDSEQDDEQHEEDTVPVH